MGTVTLRVNIAHMNTSSSGMITALNIYWTAKSRHMKKLFDWFTNLDGMGAGCLIRSIALFCILMAVLLTVLLSIKG